MTDRCVRSRAAGIAVLSGLGLGASAMPPLPPDEGATADRAVTLAATIQHDVIEQPQSAPQPGPQPGLEAGPEGGPEPGPDPAPTGASSDTAAPESGAAAPVAMDEPGRFGWILDGWVRRIEIGASGTEGNSQTGSFRGSLQLTRKEGLNELFAETTYQRASRESETTQDRLAASARYDRLMAESRWRYFATGTYESDRFRDWNHRWTSGGGFGFQAIREGETSVLARGGMSLAQDIGGADEDLRTEAILGMDLTHRIDDRQRITGSIDFLPNVSDLDEFRINARAGWEFLVDPESNLSLRIGGEDRYDATATGGSERNDLSYYAVIAVEF